MDRLALLTIALATAIMGIAVYHRAPDRVWNRLFTVHASAVSIWVMLNYLIQAAGTPAEAAIYIRLCHPVVALVICTNVDLFWAFPERVEFAPLPQRLVLYTVGLLFSLTGLAPDLIRSVQLAEGTVLVTYGWPFLAFGLFTVVTLGYADLVLVWKRPRLSGLQRVQVHYVLTGMIISQGLAIITMVILPVVWNNTYYSRWGSAGYIFMIGFLAYAIAKHGIVRPVVALHHASAYVLTGVLISIALVGIVLVSRPLAVMSPASLLIVCVLGGVVVGVMSVPVHQLIRSELDRGLPGRSLADTVKQASDAVLRTLDSAELPDYLARTMAATLRLTHVSVFLQDNVSGGLVRKAAYLPSGVDERPQWPRRLAPDALLTKIMSRRSGLLDRSQIRRFHSLQEAREILAAMRQFQAEIIAPLFWEDRLMGLVILGEKLSGDMYGPEELELLRNFLPQVSLAIRNAQLYDEMVQLKEYNENILRQMQSGVIAVNADRTVAIINPAAEELLGLAAEEVIGRDLTVLPEAIARRLALALAGLARRHEDRIQILKPGGDTVPVACSTSLWRGSPLSQQGAIIVISDLTLVEELEREKRDAEHLALIRIISAGMAHELRNPLVAIRTFAELLPTHWQEQDFRGDFLRTTQEEVERIDRLLTDLLMLSKPATAVVEDLDVNAVCEGVARAMSASALTKNVSLCTDLAYQGLPPTGDPSRLHQALINLVKNAVEAEPVSGQVVIASRHERGSDDRDVAVICVHNDGSHIAEEQLTEIFKPFYTRRPGGTGLGLAICQTIIEEHQGNIRASSTSGQGTDFIIHLPAKSPNGDDSQ